MGTVREPLKILSLDGGGIRGISSLLILEHIMEKIRDARKLGHVPRPCEYFDLIGGTSTGGIIAIMLGRLRMTVDECIRAYRKVAQQAFTPKKTTLFPASPAGAFSAKALEAVIKQTVRKFCVEPECVSRRSQGYSTAETCTHSDIPFRDSSCTKTVILAITKDNVDARPTLFTTYDMSARLHGCTIWQVARATSAATTFFKPIRVGRDEIEFVDAGFGYNNPCEVLIEEAGRQFPRHPDMRVLSIGTGRGDVVEIGQTRMSIINALKKMATSSQKVAASLENRFGGSRQYFRFNVDRGLQDVTLSDWEKASTISAHTQNYLNDNQRSIQEFVDSLVGTAAQAEEVPPTTTPALAETVTTAVELPTASNSRVIGPWYHLPLSENKRFVGRKETLATLNQKLFTERCQSIALVGLGGVGKTQAALELAYGAKKDHPELSIFWVPALSGATFEQAYIELARELPVQKRSEDEDPKESVRRFLSSKAAGPWLFIVDNADDADVVFGPPDAPDGISRFFPESDDGRILFTTRSRKVAVELPRADVIELHEMDYEDAISLLEKCLIQKDLIKDTAVDMLLSELTHLPLAIVQAAAYLNKNQILIAEYLGLLRSTEDNMIRLLSREFRDSTRYTESQNAVAKTWLVSFEQIQKADSFAADLLSFISCIEPKSIPQSILPGLGTEEMVNAIGTLRGYVFLVKREGDLFDMHSLVHVATKVWLGNHKHEDHAQAETIKHLAAIFPPSNRENRETWRVYLPHAMRVLSRSAGCSTEERYDLFLSVGRCLDADRRFKEAISCFTEVCQWREDLAEDDQSRLASEHTLASAYLDDRRIKEAINMLEHIVAVQKQTLAEDDQSRLTSEHELARAYLDDRRIKEAINMLEHIVAVRKQTLAEDDQSRLNSEHALASAYLDDRRIKEAINMLEHIVAVQKQTLAEDDQFRLNSEHALASAYLDDRRIKEAINMLEHIVAVRKQTLVEDDQSRLNSEHELARAYLDDRRIKEAISMLEHIVAVRKQTLAEDDQSRLTSEHELARAYLDDRRIKEAINMLEHIVAVRKQTLAEDDQSRLASEHTLASAYLDDRRIKEAINMLEHIVAVQKQTLAEDDQFRLNSEHALASAYLDDRRIKEAINMLEHIVAVRKQTLAEDDQSRLASEHALASAYLNDRRIKEAINMLEHIVAVQKQTLAEDDQFRLASEHVLASAYLNDRRIKEAINMFEHIVAVRKQTLAEDDQFRLASEHELARAYLDDRRIKEAINMLEHIVAVQKQTLAEDDQFRLNSEHALASAYLDD